MLVTTIDNSYQLETLFKDYGRGDQFSYYGYQALYNYLYDLSERTGEDIKIYVIGLCCAFTEYLDYKEIYKDYSYSYNNDSENFEDINLSDFKEWLNNRTIVLECTDDKDLLQGVIIQVF